MRGGRRTVAWAVCASLGTHLAAMSALSGVPVVEATATTYDATLDVSEVTQALAASGAKPSPEHAPPPTVGGPETQNVDAVHTGGGGEATGAREVIVLVTRSDTMTLTSRVTNASEANQEQRIRTARDRATPWQGRATPSASDAPFLASGEGERRERRVPDPRDAAEGVRTAGARTAAGRTASELDDAATRAQTGGMARAHAGAGVSGGTGRVATTSADVAHARPAVDRGLPTVTAPVIYELPRDTVDSEALTSRLTQSFVDTSRRAATRAGEGAGGDGARGAEGSGVGRDVGGHAAPYAPGAGADGTLDLASGRYRTFYLALRREVERHLTFPRERALRLDQGHAVFRVTLRRDGTLARPPVLVRSTGFTDLDAASRDAIERARPPALPADLAPEASTVTIRLNIASRNPVAR